MAPRPTNGKRCVYRMRLFFTLKMLIMWFVHTMFGGSSYILHIYLLKVSMCPSVFNQTHIPITIRRRHSFTQYKVMLIYFTCLSNQH